MSKANDELDHLGGRHVDFHELYRNLQQSQRVIAIHVNMNKTIDTCSEPTLSSRANAAAVPPHPN